EFVGNAKSNVVGLHRSHATRRLIQQGGDSHGSGLMLLQVFSKESESQTRIQDVFHQDHVLVAQRRGYVLNELNFAVGLLLRAVTTHGNEIEGGIQLDLPRQVA